MEARSLDFSQLRKQFERQRQDTSTLWLSLAPTYACNCRCPYCYEQDKAVAKTLMSPQVEQAIHDFVQQRYDQQGFQTISVQWYGGEPTLCLDIVNRMSQGLIAWCEGHGVRYEAKLLSNCLLMDAQAAKLLAGCKVTSALLTIDGPREVHNLRRPAADGSDSYQHVLDGIAHLQAAGISCFCLMNIDKANAPHYPEISRMMGERGVFVMPAKLNDYSHTLNQPGCGAFCAPNFDLFTHEEYAQFMLERFKARGGSAQELQAMMTPCDHFCTGQKNNSFVIDCFGDVYKCDGWMGDKAHVLFNLLTDEPVLDAICFDPFADEKCRECDILDVCWGNCSWERERCGWPCHPLKYTLEGYLEFCGLL